MQKTNDKKEGRFFMSTCGNFGLKKNGVSKLTYCHFDSYPEGLGEDLVSLIKGTTIEKLHEVYDTILMVEEYEYPNEEQTKHIRKWFDTEEREWYSVLRNAQGKPVFKALLEGLKYMVSNVDGGESYSYVIDLDRNMFVINDGNLGEFDLENIPEDWLEIVKQKER